LLLYFVFTPLTVLPLLPATTLNIVSYRYSRAVGARGTLNALSVGEVIIVKVAVPEWKERVSPVFDTARSVLVVNVDARKEVGRSRIELRNGPLQDRVSALTASGVTVLLCGAISRPLYDMLESAGIEVTAFLSGPTEVLLEAFMEERITDPRFLMPGCCGKRRRRNRGRRNRSREGKEIL